MYKVIKAFADLEDANHIYHEGDVYPREGKSPSDKRIAFLASSENLLKTPVIKKVSEYGKAEEIAMNPPVEDVQEYTPKRRGRKSKAKKESVEE